MKLQVSIKNISGRIILQMTDHLTFLFETVLRDAIGMFQLMTFVWLNKKTPKNYQINKVTNTLHPKRRFCAENRRIPQIQTNRWLKTGANFAFKTRKIGQWTKPEYRHYLSTIAITEKVSENIESKL